MSKTKVKNIPNQAVRAMRITNESAELYNHKVEYGHLSFREVDEDITASHLMFIYLSGISKFKDNEWMFCVPTKVLAKNLSLSERQVSRSLKELLDRKAIIKTTTVISYTYAYIIPRPYQSKIDYTVPTILAITKTIPLSLKLFILKLHLSMPSNKTSIRIFENKTGMRSIIDNSVILNNNLSELESKGLMTLTKDNEYIIDLAQVYHELHQEFISSFLKSSNLI